MTKKKARVGFALSQMKGPSKKVVDSSKWESLDPESEEGKRFDLAVAHRVSNLYGMDELVWNHISARHGSGWLITPGTMHWDEIGPSDIKMCSDNVTADIIHKAVYDVRPDVGAIVHLHTKAAVAVGLMEGGFEPFTQDGSYFFKKVAEHEWEGVSDDPTEGPRIGNAVLGVQDCNILMMPNHGFCSLGRTIKEAWIQAFYFEKACESQVLAMSMGGKIKRPDPTIMAKSAKQNYTELFAPGLCEWESLRREAVRKFGEI